MPANLNALIRYKTINSCLAGGRRRWSIDELRERCSEALAEDRGRYSTVSERTIRDDIRVMRSDILGFNAPIKQEGGLYFYSDPAYSILSLSITDAGLAEQIYWLLMNMRDKVSHPELEIILQRLCDMLGKEYKPVPVAEAMEEPAEEEMLRDEIVIRRQIIFDEMAESSGRFPSKSSRARDFRFIKPGLSWNDVLRLLTGKRGQL
ncbi:MAG: hypothetical protein GX646_03745 [Bacteroidales bacterium]|jgi:hypothetical protein|nr:hypothetical protein [Bacteroidales bacterium]